MSSSFLGAQPRTPVPLVYVEKNGKRTRWYHPYGASLMVSPYHTSEQLWQICTCLGRFAWQVNVTWPGCVKIGRSGL